MNLRCGEPRLNDLLADSIVRAVMEADGVDPRELKAQLRRTAAVLNAARLKRPGYLPGLANQTDAEQDLQVR